MEHEAGEQKHHEQQRARGAALLFHHVFQAVAEGGGIRGHAGSKAVPFPGCV